MKLKYAKNHNFVIKEGLRALLKASRELKCRNLLVITSDQEGTERLKGRTVRYTPLCKWLLSSGKYK